MPAQDIPAIPDEAVDVRARTPLRRMLEELRRILGFYGDPLDKAVIYRDLKAAGYVDTAALARARPGSNGVPLVPPGQTVTDNTPPPIATGLIVSATFDHIIVEWNVAAFAQGGGNSTTRIYAAQRNPGDPQATFAQAELVYEAPHPLTIAAIPSAVNIRWHVWIKFVSKDGIEAADPAGGTNGVIVTTGLIDGGTMIQDATISNAKIVSLSAAKITAGTMQVGAYIRSTTWPNGGFELLAAGALKFNDAAGVRRVQVGDLSL